MGNLTPPALPPSMDTPMMLPEGSVSTWTALITAQSVATHGILGCYTLQSDPALKVGKPRPERSRSSFGVTQRDLGHTAFTSVKAQCANRVEWLKPSLASAHQDMHLPGDWIHPEARLRVSAHQLIMETVSPSAQHLLPCITLTRMIRYTLPPSPLLCVRGQQ